MKGDAMAIIDRDADGEPIKAGDLVSISFGIPPMRVEGSLFERDGKLIMPTRGCNPSEATIGQLRTFVGGVRMVRK